MAEKDKQLILVLKQSAEHLVTYINDVNNLGGLQKITHLYEHAICDCIDRIGDGVKRLKVLEYSKDCQKSWTGLRIYSAHKYEKLNLLMVWDALLQASSNFILESEQLINT